jgi:hypothetical protein
MKMNFTQWSLDTSKVNIIIINHFFQFFYSLRDAKVYTLTIYDEFVWTLKGKVQNNDKWDKMVTYEVPCAMMIGHMQWVLLGIIVMYMVGLFDKGWISNTIIHASYIRLWIMFTRNDKRGIWMFWMVLNLKKSQMKQISNKSPITKNGNKEWGWHSTPQLMSVVPFNNIIDKKN